ncbi:MAG: alpha/beta fold hydrolase [Candidatus Lokiarchaeota archaeon]|nr:alpha/beta fold hydrolase [Candidatus Lokiarchaeota archaeon]MBD3202527.1 alpha/beta fold hydrolase [Candidatus Lokiarchaeota archaeon]
MKLESIIKEKFVKINDITLHTIFAGTDSGKPLILLHGFPDFWYGWNNIIKGLKDDFFLIVPDLRGYNLSDKPEGVKNYTLDVLVDDVKHLCETLGINNVNLAGHDWGGIIAWAFGEKYPNLLNKLIILNAPHPKVFRKKIEKDSSQRRASGYIKELIKPNSEALLKQNNYQMLQFSVFGTARKRDAFDAKDKEKYLEAWSQEKALDRSANYYRANRRYEEWTGIIKVPTLVIHGMKDNFIKPTVLDGLEEYVGDLKIVKSPKSSHWIMHDDPEIVISSIKKFMHF